jgi:hypothetical protein
MNEISLQKKTGIVALVAVFMAVIIVVPNVAFATSSTSAEENTVQVTAYAKGIAIQKIDNETVKTPANLTLVAEPVERGEKLITFKIVGGKVDVNGTVYVISGGKGIVVKPLHMVLLRCNGTSPDGTEVLLSLRAKYFWMGGHLYVARIKGILKVGEDTRMLLLLRGYARIP